MQSNTLGSFEAKTSGLKTIIPFLLYLLIYFLFFILDFESIISYSIIYVSASLSFIYLCRYIFNVHLFKNQVYLLIVCGIILRITFLFFQPIGSDDYYRYLWDGKILANGINPYQYSPADEELIPFHSETLPEKVTFPHIKTIYPPLSQLLFYLSYSVGGESFYGLKIFLFLFELASLWGLLLILRELKLPEKNILLYALAPLPVFQLFIDAHLDGFGLTLIIFSILFYLKNKKIMSLIFIGLSICIKPLGLILIPIIFIMEKGIKIKLQTIIIPAITCILIYLPFISAGTFEALLNFTVNWTFNGFIFEIINSFLNNNQSSRMICGILFLLTYIIIILSRLDFLNKVYLSIFFLLIFSPVVHPWYAVWLAVLLPFIPKWSGILFTTLISLTVFTILNYKLYGEWEDYPLVLILEYVPVLVVFLYELKNLKLKTYKRAK